MSRSVGSWKRGQASSGGAGNAPRLSGLVEVVNVRGKKGPREEVTEDAGASLGRLHRFLLLLSGLNPRKVSRLPDEAWILCLPAVVMLVVIPVSAVGVAHFAERLSGSRALGVAVWAVVVVETAKLLTSYKSQLCRVRRPFDEETRVRNVVGLWSGMVKRGR